MKVYKYIFGLLITIIMLSAEPNFYKPKTQKYFSRRRLYPITEKLPQFETVIVNNDTYSNITREMFHTDKQILEVSLNYDATKIAVTIIVKGKPRIFFINPLEMYLKEFSQRRGITDKNPCITANGSDIFFVSDRYENKEIFKFNVETDELSVIIDNQSHNYNLSISADGSVISYTSEKEQFEPMCYVKDLKTGNEKIVSFPFVNVYKSKLSSDGKYIAYEADDDEHNFEIFFASIEEEYVINVSDNFKLDECPDITADGNRIIFQSTRTGDYEIFMLDRKELKFFNISDNIKNTDKKPAISDDGNIIVWESYEKWLTSTITVLNLEQKKKYVFYHRDEYKTDPILSKDGKTLIFIMKDKYYTADLNRIFTEN